MHFINPFKGLRPTKKFVSSVVIPSTDHLSDSIITDHKKNNPCLLYTSDAADE